MNWDLLRTFEAVARLGSLTEAGRALGISQSTVSRHISRLEQDAGSPVLLREPPVRLTERGVALLAAVQPMVDAGLAAEAALEDEPELRGGVTITTVGEVIRWRLTRHLAKFYATYPHLRLRILADNRVNSLAAGDADIALRFARPLRGDLISRRLHTETYGLFVGAQLEGQGSVPWLGLTGSLGDIPEQRYAEQVFGSCPARLLLEDAESLGLAVEAGLGAAVLPRQFASRLRGVVEADPESVGAHDLGPIEPRELWMVVHRAKQKLPKVRAIIRWLTESFAD